MLYGTSDSEPQTEYVVAQLSQELYNSNLLLLLIQVSKQTHTIYIFVEAKKNLGDDAFFKQWLWKMKLFDIWIDPALSSLYLLINIFPT